MKTLTPEQRAELVNAGWTPPKTQVIDWSKVACHVPVAVLKSPNSIGHDILFRRDHGLAAHVWVPGPGATLETGLWVVNVDGQQPVPDGVLVEVPDRDDLRPMEHTPRRAEALDWTLRCRHDDIIAFKVVGLAEGYSYE